MNKWPTQTAGFSLIEIVIFLLVAAIILPAIILPFVEGTRKLNDPTIVATMAFLAQEELERNKAMTYDEINGWSDQTWASFPGYESDGYYTFVDPADFVTETTVALWKRLYVTITHTNDEDMPALEATTVFYGGASQ